MYTPQAINKSSTKQTMKKKIVKQLLIRLFLLTVIGVNYVQVQIKPGVLIQLQEMAKDISWLFGTYYLINDSYPDETPAGLNAFGKSKHLMVEVIINSTELTSANSRGVCT